MPHNKDTPIEVIQADRDAAIKLVEMWHSKAVAMHGHPTDTQEGRCDHTPLVQAFARHRLAHSPTPIDPSDEQVERARNILAAQWDRPDKERARLIREGKSDLRAIDAMLSFAALRSPVPRELREALEPFAAMRLSTEGEVSDCVYRTPAEEARLQAERIEQRDREILRARHLIQKERSQ